MKVLWKKTIKEQIWYGNKTLNSDYDCAGLRYSELPSDEVYESENFESVYAYLEEHGTAASKGITLLNHHPIIVFHPPFSYDMARISKQKFRKYQHVIKGIEYPVRRYTLAYLQNNLPATEFIDFLKDNFENPLDKLSNL